MANFSVCPTEGSTFLSLTCWGLENSLQKQIPWIQAPFLLSKPLSRHFWELHISKHSAFVWWLWEISASLMLTITLSPRVKTEQSRRVPWSQSFLLLWISVVVSIFSMCVVHLCVHAFMCADACVWGWTCVCVHVTVRGWVPSSIGYHLISEMFSSWARSSIIWLQWLASETHGSTGLVLQTGSYRHMPLSYLFFTWVLGIKNGFHVYVASTLLTETFPQPCFCFSKSHYSGRSRVVSGKSVM